MQRHFQNLILEHTPLSLKIITWTTSLIVFILAKKVVYIHNEGGFLKHNWASNDEHLLMELDRNSAVGQQKNLNVVINA